MMPTDRAVPRRAVHAVLLLAGVGLGVFLVTRLMPGGGAVAGEWEPVEVLGLTVAAPGPFRVLDVPVPAAIRTSIERMESHALDAGRTEVTVTRIDYRAGVPLSLEGSAQGAVDAMRQNPAVTGMSHRHAPARVSGIPAVRTTTGFRVQGNATHGEILTLLRGRTLWQVQVLGPEAVAPAIGRRVMESVRVGT